MTRITLTLAAALLAGLAMPALAGPEKVEFPAYKSFKSFGQIDRYENNTVRVLFANDAAVAAEPGKPLPSGSVLVLETRPAKLGPDGKPLLDANGRFQADDKVTGVLVQEKRTGWATEYEEKIRNPDWEYAVFEADGTRRASAATQPCMACHKPRAADDYTFVFAHVVRDLKGKP